MSLSGIWSTVQRKYHTSHIFNFKFPTRHIFLNKKKCKINLNNIFYLTQSSQHVSNIKIINEILYNLSKSLSPQNLVCIWHSWRISIWINNVSSAQEPHVANGNCTEQCRSKGLANNPKFIMKLISSCVFHVRVLDCL